jgi:hypothetical protein
MAFGTWRASSKPTRSRSAKERAFFLKCHLGKDTLAFARPNRPVDGVGHDAPGHMAYRFVSTVRSSIVNSSAIPFPPLIGRTRDAIVGQENNVTFALKMCRERRKDPGRSAAQATTEKQDDGRSLVLDPPPLWPVNQGRIALAVDRHIVSLRKLLLAVRVGLFHVTVEQFLPIR